MQSSIKGTVDIAQSVIGICALLVGGAWTYYRFIRGRLFSPKIELSMTHVVGMSSDPDHYIVFCEICVKNVGLIQLRLGPSAAKCFSLESTDKLIETSVFEKSDIVRYEDDPPEGDYYVDPGESTYRQFRFLAPARPPLLLVSVRLMYNRVHMVDRKFVLVNTPTPNK